MQYCLSIEDGIYELFGSAEVKVLVMGYLIISVCLIHLTTHVFPLLKVLGVIHKNGVVHGDLRAFNVAMGDGRDPYSVDFSYGFINDCKGPESCPELIRAYSGKKPFRPNPLSELPWICL
jgi:hypothetical protein